MDALKEIKKRLDWQDLLLAAVIIVYLITQQNIISGYLQLPSPLYGGDLYFQLGSVNHIKYGGDALAAPNILGSQPCYFILYGLLVAALSNLLSLDGISAMFTFSQILVVLSLIAFYALGTYVFKDKTLALVGAVVFLNIRLYPVLKYTEFTRVLIMPLFFLAMFRLIEKKNVSAAVAAGVTLGLCGISHGSALPTAGLFIIISAAYMILSEYVHPTKEMADGRLRLKLNLDSAGLRKNLPLVVKLTTVACAIGFLISMLYWYAPIFVYHGKTLNDMQNWAFPDYGNPRYSEAYLKGTVGDYFTAYSDVLSAAKSTLALLGLAVLAAAAVGRVKWTTPMKYTALLLLLAAAASFHYVITLPLFGTHFSPDSMRNFTVPLLVSFLIMTTLDYAYRRLDLGDYGKYFSVALVVALLVLQQASYVSYLKTDQWAQVGKKPLSADMAAVRDWTLKNTEVNDVFLSANELSFSLNALTGRKLVVSRRSHNSPFLDFDQREADAEVILAGNSTEKRLELLKKYDVKYLYWHAYWISSEYAINDQGRIVDFSDALMVKDTPEYRKYFEEYGVQYSPQFGYMDPAMRGEYYKKHNLLVMIPNYKSAEQPWVSGLDPYLEQVWEYNESGYAIARMYKVKY